MSDVPMTEEELDALDQSNFARVQALQEQGIQIGGLREGFMAHQLEHIARTLGCWNAGRQAFLQEVSAMLDQNEKQLHERALAAKFGVDRNPYNPLNSGPLS